MKEKVAQAIEKRGKAKIHNAAQKLREAVRRFVDDCGLNWNEHAHSKEIAKLLRALANEYDGTSKKLIVPAYFWNEANERAYDEFMNQFDALTRFVNHGIELKDGNCVMPGEEPVEEIITLSSSPTIDDSDPS